MSVAWRRRMYYDEYTVVDEDDPQTALRDFQAAQDPETMRLAEAAMWATHDRVFADNEPGSFVRMLEMERL